VNATDLADRLLAALDHAEAVARAASPGPWRLTPNGEVESAPLTEGDWMRAHIAGYFGHYEVQTPAADCAFIAANDPGHVLRAVAAHRQIVDNYALVLRQSEENSEKFVRLSRTTNWTDRVWSEQMTNVKTFGWECAGRVAAAEAAVKAIASIYLPDTDQGEPR
jgi:hypothetical protein